MSLSFVGKPPHIASPLTRFEAIEGLRGYLALIVIAYHLLSATNVAEHFGFDRYGTLLGGGSVDVFIMISGFVMANLLIQRPEPWLPFITRRAFRIFPVYWVVLLFSGLAMFLRQDAFAFMTWADSPLFVDNIARHNADVAAVVADPATQILVHVGLLQSAVPAALVPNAPHAILVPAWSLSLEWQFYLVAPALVWLLRRHIGALCLVLGTLLMVVAINKFGSLDWISWASLPRYLPFFLVGMLTYIATPSLRGLGGNAWPIAAGIFGLGLYWNAPLSVVVWVAFAVLMTRKSGAETTVAMLDKAFAGAFESKWPAWLGQRSYSMYIVHYPLIWATSWAIHRLYPFTRLEALIATSIIVVPLTIILADLLYKFVEKPMIGVGRRVASNLTKGEQSVPVNGLHHNPSAS